MLRLLAGAAAIAMAASPVYAQPGKNGNGNGGGKPAAAAKGNGGAKGNAGAKGGNDNRGPAMKADRGPGNGNGAGNAKKSQAMARSNGNGNGGAKANNAGARGNGNGNGGAKADLRRVKASNNGNRANADRRIVSQRYDDRDGYAGGLLRTALGTNRGLIDGCPPGLAKKNNGCLPPGQARERYDSYRPSLFGFGGLGDGRYYLNDGYLLRYRDSGLAGYIPLLAGALSIGNQWPGSYYNEPLPDYYVDYYRLGANSGYRYADNVIYRVDPETSAINSIAAILTGDDFVVGQPMPMGYDVYNVPYDYRDRYYDTPEAHYRYSDGYVYRIDPKTALISAAIDLLI